MTALGDKAVQTRAKLDPLRKRDAGRRGRARCSHPDAQVQRASPSGVSISRRRARRRSTISMPASATGRRIFASPGTSTSCRRATRNCGRHPPFAAEIEGRHALRQRRRRHEGRDRLLHRSGARLRQATRPGDRRLDQPPHHRRRGRACHQRHAQGARLDEGARASAPTIAWSASRPTPSASARRSRSAAAAA